MDDQVQKWQEAVSQPQTTPPQPTQTVNPQTIEPQQTSQAPSSPQPLQQPINQVPQAQTAPQSAPTPVEEKKSSKLKIILIIIIVIIALMALVAIIIVPSLLVVGLTTQLAAPSSGVTTMQSLQAWKTAAPFAIIDWSQKSDGTFIAILQNNSPSNLTLNSVTINGVTTQGNETMKNITPGSKVQLSINLASCTPGTKYAYTRETISINYSTEAIPNLTETAMADIVGTCN